MDACATEVGSFRAPAARLSCPRSSRRIDALRTADLRWLRHRYLGGFKFRRQHPVDRYILDFYCVALKLAIEIDGSSHDTDARARYDDARTRWLTLRGITVLRLRNEHIAEQPDGAWALIVEAVAKLAR